MTEPESTPSGQSSVGPAQQNRKAPGGGGFAAFLLIIAGGIYVGGHLLSGGDKHLAKADKLDLYKLGAVVTVTNDFYSCTALDDLSQIKSFLVARDTVAAARYAGQMSCDPFRAGEEAVVENESAWHAAVCLRSPGETACRWFPAAFVKGADDQKIGG